MTDDDMTVRADAIAQMMLAAPEDEAGDIMDGQMMGAGILPPPFLYYAVYERQVQVNRLLAAVSVWRLFVAYLEEKAELLDKDDTAYADAVSALGAFIQSFGERMEDFAAFDIFSEKVNTSIARFDEVTMGGHPAGALQKDKLALGDQSLASGDALLAATFYRQAAEDDGKPEGWLRLLQVMSETDLGAAYGSVAAADFRDKAVKGGFWVARAYYLLRLLSATDADEGKPEVVSAEMRADMQQQVKAFMADFTAHTQPLPVNDFSKYMTPVRAEFAVDVFHSENPRLVAARLEAVTRNNAVKVGIGAFLQVAVFMFRHGWIRTADLAGIDDVLSRYENTLTEESRLLTESIVHASSETVSAQAFEAEQKRLSISVVNINAAIAQAIVETREILTEHR